MPLPPSTVHAGQSVTFHCAVPIGSEIAVQFRVKSRREQQQKVVTTFEMRLLRERRLVADGVTMLICDSPQ